MTRPAAPAPPMLPAVREALQTLLEHIPVELRGDVREFARQAGALAYEQGYRDGLEDGALDTVGDELDAELSVISGGFGDVLPLIPKQRITETEGMPPLTVLAGTFGADDGDPTVCFSAWNGTELRFRCDLPQQHRGLHQHFEFGLRRLFLWGSGALLAAVDSRALDALLYEALDTFRLDMDRIRQLAAAVRSPNPKDCL